MVIWKYPMGKGQRFSIMMPKWARILSCQIQNGKPVIWALVNSEASKEWRRFIIMETGEEVRLTGSPRIVLEFIDTVQLSDDTVQHLFEITSKKH